MSITYSWDFPQFETVPSLDGFSDVVRVIHWRLNAVDGDESASVYGSVGLAEPESGSFIPYASITKDWAIEQVSASLDVPALEASLAQIIEDIKNPPVIKSPPPFI